MHHTYKNRRNTIVSLSSAESSQAAFRYRFQVSWLVVGVFVGGFGLLLGNSVKSEPLSGDSRPASSQTEALPPQTPFPTLATAAFTNTQKRILSLIQQEYEKRPVSYDRTVLKYTEGFRESWCADFISWVRNEAGVPFRHPTTGYWRIPGVQTAQDYYAKYDAFHAVGEYTPKFGDVAFYFGETPDGQSSEHVAFVLSVQGDTITTLGGNEADRGIMQIRTNKLLEGERGLVGFGESAL